MRWTKDRPTENGWYCYRPTSEDRADYGVPVDRQQIVEITNLYAQFPCYKDQLLIEDLNGDWAGPIAPPPT